MLKSFRFFYGWGLLLILAGCVAEVKPTAKHLSDLQARNAALRIEKELLEQEHFSKRRQIDHFIEKIGVLQEEKRDGDKNISIARQQIKSSFTNLMKICEDSEEDLYDCYFGNAPITRGMYLSNNQKMLLIDRKNHVNVDKVIFCGGEVCLENTATVQFCILRPAREKKDHYVVERISQEFICKTPGRQKIVFPRDKRLTAFYGNLVGVLITPHAGVYYDAGGTGITSEIPVKKVIPGKTVIKLPYLPELSSFQPDLKSQSKAFSFRLFGSTYLN